MKTTQTHGKRLFAALALIGLSISGWALLAPGTARTDDTYEKLELFAEILTRVQAEYIEPVDYGDMIEASIDGMLSSLDPHSNYMDAEDFQNMRVQSSGQYGGLGIEVTSEKGLIRIISPMDDTPAMRAGLKAGDYISAVDGKSIVGLTLSEAVKQMRGPPGADIILTILRKEEDPFTVTLTREIIRPQSVTHKMYEDIGYVRVSGFNERTSDSLEKALKSIKKEAPEIGLKGLVLDLRNNPGGLLSQAIDVSSAFLDGGEVVSTRGRRSNSIKRFNASRGGKILDTPMVILINSGSASASEIVAGALQDRSRATLLGSVSFGKGSVQTIIPLGAGQGAIRLTISRYYTPSGRSIQGAGIAPDFAVSQTRLSKEAQEALAKKTESGLGPRIEANLRNALDNDQGLTRSTPETPAEQPPEAYEGEDYQLDRALELLSTNQIPKGSG